MPIGFKGFQKGHRLNIKNKYAFKHGFDGTHFCRVFSRMKERCNNKNKDNFNSYGGRGIKVLWKSFEDFKNDMYDSYLEHLNKNGHKNTQIERIDVNGNYCKENCKWATIKEQSLNRRTNVFISFNNKRKTISEWAEEMGITRSAMRYRILKSKFSLEESLTITK